MLIDLIISAIKAIFVVLLVLNLSAVLLWFERKGSALIQDRIGANRAGLFGIGRRLGLPNLGIINTFIADPLKIFTKEDFVPDRADKFLYTLAPFLALFPVLISFAPIPFGDRLIVGSHQIELVVCPLTAGILYILAALGLGVYGAALGGWASNNRWALLGSVRASAQLISYELTMGLSIIAVVMVYGTLDLQEICRAQSGTWFGWLPKWGIVYQPLGFLLLLVAGIAESRRIPFDLPEGESELVAGYFTEYSGGKQAAFMLADFAEIVLVSALISTLFFGGWQVPYLQSDGFHLPGGTWLPLSNPVVALLGFVAFGIKVVFFCWLQILIRWTLPRFRYDQLMTLGWKGLLPLGLVNLMVTAVAIVAVGGSV